MTTLAGDDRRLRYVVGLMRHRVASTAEKAPAGHPDRDADREKQTHYPGREERTHSAEQSIPLDGFCRETQPQKAQTIQRPLCPLCLFVAQIVCGSYQNRH